MYFSKILFRKLQSFGHNLSNLIIVPLFDYPIGINLKLFQTILCIYLRFHRFGDQIIEN